MEDKSPVVVVVVPLLLGQAQAQVQGFKESGGVPWDWRRTPTNPPSRRGGINLRGWRAGLLREGPEGGRERGGP